MDENRHDGARSDGSAPGKGIAKAMVSPQPSQPLHPDVDALLWIFARAAARIALEDAQAYLDQGAPYGETKKGFGRWLKEKRDADSS